MSQVVLHGVKVPRPDETAMSDPGSRLRNAGERDPHVRPAVVPALDVCVPAVRSGDQRHDRQPEAAAAAAARLVGTAEAVERTGREARRKARPFVADVQLDDAVVTLLGQGDDACAMHERVVDEVAERLLDAQGSADTTELV